MHIDILSLFPEYFDSPLNVSILKKAQQEGLLKIQCTNIRDFAEGKHQKVDKRPYGGGPGMVLMPEPLCKAIRSVRRPDSHVIYMSPQGQTLNSSTCARLASYSHLILVCGHYEGIDERVIMKEISEEISIGDYVVTNGCVASLVLIDALARFIPGVVGHPQAVQMDSFQDGLLEGPQYTRPQIFEGEEVPSVLMQGHHEEIKKWKRKKAEEKTKKMREDLYFQTCK